MFILGFHTKFNTKISVCDNVTKLFLRRHNMYFYLPQIGNPGQTKVWIPPKSNLVSQWVSLGLLQ